MVRNRCWFAILIAGVVAGGNGCQRRTQFIPVTGAVTKNGQPQARIEVIFLADSPSMTGALRVRGQTDGEGRYQLLANDKEPGAMPGAYRVLLVDAETQKSYLVRALREPTKESVRIAAPEAARRYEQAGEPSSRVPKNYSDVNDTPLRAQVGASPVVFDIEIP